MISTERAQRAFRTPKNRIHRQRNRRSLSVLESPAYLHIGCGLNELSGWTNIDNNRNSAADMRLDLRGGLPARARSVEFAYSEHVIEHVPRANARLWLSDLASSLTASGVVRIATPDLAHIVEKYQGNWKDQTWLTVEPYSAISGPAEMLNTALRDWGHTYIYDEEDLTRLLKSCGFRSVKRVPWGKSDHDTLRRLERRQDSHLILEASL